METPPPENLSAAIKELVRGQESAKMLRRLLAARQVKEESDLVAGAGKPVSAEVLVGDVLRSFTNILSVLNSGEVAQVPISDNSRCVKSEESEESSKSSTPRGRGCYKRRKGSDSVVKLTPNLIDDGHQWRKYGQKAIQSTNFPRNYYRCTYKIDQGCQATKQVQMVSEDPPMYRIIYHGDHTCKNHLKSPQIILDCPSPTGVSSIFLSFKNINNNGENLPFSSVSDRSSTGKIETNEEITPYTQQSMTMHQNYPSSDSSNFYLPSLTEMTPEVRSSSSYCSFGDSDLIDLISYY